MLENMPFWLGPVLAFEASMFALIFVVSRAILREQHHQEALEAAETGPAAATAPRSDLPRAA